MLTVGPVKQPQARPTGPASSPLLGVSALARRLLSVGAWPTFP